MKSWPKLSPLDAAVEMQRRRSARQSLISFTEFTYPKYRPSSCHRAIAGHLERVMRGEIDRLMLLTAPRHGKSELSSRRFPGLVLGQNPDKEFISVSAGADLATDFGRDVRNLIDSEEYRRLFATRLAEDSQAKNKWRTDAGGVYYAVGVGGDFMGRGADVLMIDDPFGSMADAQSPAKRKGVWDWYIGTAYNRLAPDGAIVLINHRMHEDDLSGRIIAQQAAGGDRFEIVELPAIDEDGQPLWPERFPLEALDRIRSNTIPRYWSALYQQKPVPEEGDYFKAEWLLWVDRLPPRDSLRVYGGSDYAVTADGGDFTAHAVLGLDPDDQPWLLDIWRKQTASDVWVDAFCDLVIKWKPMAWAEESGQIKAGVGPFLERAMRDRKAYVAREQFPTRGDKAVRAQSFRGMIATRGLRVPALASWRTEFETELLQFPAGVHDDQIDACLEYGTQVSMGDGSKKLIENVVVGDYVATPIGPCEVLASQETSAAARVYRLTTASGRSLVATGNHPVFVRGQGFTRVDAVGMMDQVWMEPSCSEEPQRPKSSSTGAIATGDTQTARASRIGDIFTVPNLAAGSCIATFGKMSAALFRMDTKSTMSTKTLATTLLKTSPALLLRSIVGFIRTHLKVTLANLSTWLGLEPRRLSGTVLLKVSRGTVRTASALGMAESHPPRYAGRVGVNLRLTGQEPDFVRRPAISVAKEAEVADEDDTSHLGNPLIANAVIDRSYRNGQTQPLIAPRHAECVIAIEALSAPARVRNLTVSRAHVFYANGFLTHNCGLIGQLLDVMIAGQREKPVDKSTSDGYRDRVDNWDENLDALTV